MTTYVSSRLLTTRVPVVASSRRHRHLHQTSKAFPPQPLPILPSHAEPAAALQSGKWANRWHNASSLAFLSSIPNEESSDGGWTSWELFSSSVLALAATGSFVLTAAYSQQQRRNTKRADFWKRASGFGGGGRGGGSGGSGRIPNAALLLASPGVFDDVPTPSEASTLVQPRVDVNRTNKHKSYEVSVRAVRGSRLTMEDEWFVGDGGRFAAVFDGHGGGDVSLLLREELFRTFRSELHVLTSELPGANVAPVSSLVAALRTAFSQIEQTVLEKETMQFQGSTAVAVLLHESADGQRTLVSANIGDSRAILSRNGRAVDLTTDHKPNEETEKARILGMGEAIEWDHYCKVHRVKNLSLSRAIGDRFAKPIVSAEVEIRRFLLEERDDEFVLLASDGLWDVLTSQEVTSFVKQKLEANIPDELSREEQARLKYARRKNMSRFVANEALKRGSGDNVCVVIVWLGESREQTREHDAND